MAKCKYCGKPAGLFSRSHKECKEKYEQGMQGLAGMLKKYFQGAITATKIGQKIIQNRAPYYLSDDDIAQVASKEIATYTVNLRRPYSTQILTLISGLIQNIGISYKKLNETGIMDRLSQKLMHGFLVEYFANGTPMPLVLNNINAVNNVIPISTEKKNDVYMSVLNKAATNFMKNGYITDNEEKLILSYSSQLGISLNSLPIHLGNTDLEKVSQALILKDLERGILPQTSSAVPVLLGKGESVLWVYYNTTMLQEKTQREYIGRTGGFSLRVCKGVTYRTGQFKGKPIENTYLETVGTGSLIITNKHVYFHCNTASSKLPFTKIIGVTPYSDGIEFHKETKPYRAVFQGFDSWFIMNVLSIVNN